MADHIEATKPAKIQATGNVDTVSVACKLPNGLILQCDHMVEHREPVMGGGFKEVQQARRLEETYVIAGAAVDIDKIKAGNIEHLIIGGYAITPGIPKEFWDRWLDQHKEMEIVRKSMIFAHTSDNSVRDQARDGGSLLSGLESIDPQNPQKTVKGIAAGTREAA